jgi:hypothetical protein
MNHTTSVKPHIAIDPTTVVGWGVDADPKNDPTYPYRDRSKDDHSGEWLRPVQQDVNVEILQSIEHKQRPAVVGTPVPPSGFSGALRRLAFTKSESNLLHWVLLLGADRINVVEGVAQDLRRARVPNIPGEMGAGADWKYNKSGLALKALVAAGLIAVVGVAVARARSSR